MKLRLPAILNKFQSFEVLGFNILKYKSKGSFFIIALIKKGYLIVKSPMCNLFFRVKNRKKFINMIFLKNVAFLITRRLYWVISAKRKYFVCLIIMISGFKFSIFF